MQFHFLFFVASLSLLYQFCTCDEADKVEQAFKSNEITSKFIEVAPPEKLEVKYTKSHKEVDLGNEIAPKDVGEIPEVDYDAHDDSYYTLVMVDPDAPSRKNPTRGEFQHWLVVNIPGSKVAEGETLNEYIGSGPPKDTGLHRYIFLVYKQPGKVTFNEPHLTIHQAKGRANFSIKNFAEQYKLGNPIAGNFYQAQYDDSVPALHKLFTD